ncbi:hypothetical protein KNE206_10520 [Kitasatospora sp. NE20-6]
MTLGQFEVIWVMALCGAAALAWWLLEYAGRPPKDRGTGDGPGGTP